VICQRLRFYPDIGMRLPECEILRPTHAVKNFIRRGEFHQITSTMETGAEHGMWTFTRYRGWMASRKDWHSSGRDTRAAVAEEESRPGAVPLPRVPAATGVTDPGTPAAATSKASAETRIEIEPDEGGLEKILRKLT
jgi:twitching motility protein PilT